MNRSCREDRGLGAVSDRDKLGGGWEEREREKEEKEEVHKLPANRSGQSRLEKVSSAGGTDLPRESQITSKHPGTVSRSGQEQAN